MASLAHARKVERERFSSPARQSVSHQSEVRLQLRRLLGGGLPARWVGGRAVLTLFNGSLPRRSVGTHSEGEGPERWRDAVAQRRQVDRLEGGRGR